MKAISLWQPWASLMAAGYKRIETRNWAPRGLRAGDLVAIHAAKRWTADERGLCASDPFFKRYLTLAERRGLWDFEQPPLGCVVAIARFERALPVEQIRLQRFARFYTGDNAKREWITEREYVFGHYGVGRFGWVFSEVRPIQPVPLRGERNLFEWAPPADAVVYLDAADAATDVATATLQAQPTPLADTTRVVHVRRGEFDPANPNHIYIGRPMPRYPELRARGWGNPFTARNLSFGYDNAIDAYRDWVMRQPKLMARLPELRGKVLGCWCAPVGGLPGNLHGRVCHGEVLAALADGATVEGARA